MDELAFVSATELAARIQRRELSAVEALSHYLQRVDRFNPTLNAIVVDARKRARDLAEHADAALQQGHEIGPLHGVPMTFKESYNLTGTPTTWGNPDWRENFPEHDADAVVRLEAAGALVFGKTNVPLALADFQSYNDIYGTTSNPYDLSRVPGGSSGGAAAALAAGLTGLEMGSDIGGSIRNPAHYCGVFGHKPTWGLLSPRGHSGPGDTRAYPDIAVVGPLARSTSDLDAVVRLLAGPDAIRARGYRLQLPEAAADTPRGLRIAVWREDPMCPGAADVRQRIDQVARTLEAAGALIDDQARPDFSSEQSHATYQRLLQAAMSARMPPARFRRLQERVAALDPQDQSRAAMILRAQVSSHRDWLEASEQRHQLRWRWHEFFAAYDLVLMPVMPTAAFRHDHRAFGERTADIDGETVPYFDQVFWAGLTGVANLPSTVVPTGLNAAGLPIGIQVVGPEYADLQTIGLARWLEVAGYQFTPPSQFL